MPPVKLDVLPLPDLREIDGRVWFTLRLDDKMKWQPDRWRDPARDEDIHTVLAAQDLGSFDDRAKRLSEITGRSEYDCRRALREKKWWSSANRYVSLTAAAFHKQSREPVPSSSSLFWLYRDRLIKVTGEESSEELILRIKHKVLGHERALDRIKREVEAFENFERLEANHRAPIPERVRMFVWQRDGGRCVSCGCQERLEYDHIIPLAAGGSNTERNIQLLCESCNRKKGAAV